MIDSITILEKAAPINRSKRLFNDKASLVALRRDEIVDFRGVAFFLFLAGSE